MSVQRIDIARLSDLPSIRGKRFVVEGGEEIVLWRTESGVVAARNMCPHQHFNTLHEGRVVDGTVECPMHGWTFNLATGKAVVGSGCLTLYPVHMKGERILVDIDDGSAED